MTLFSEKFQTPKRLNKIRKLETKEARVKSLIALACDLGVDDEWGKKKMDSVDEVKLIQCIRKKHQEFVTQFLVKIGFILIVLSGITAVLKSF